MPNATVDTHCETCNRFMYKVSEYQASSIGKCYCTTCLPKKPARSKRKIEKYGD